MNTMNGQRQAARLLPIEETLKTAKPARRSRKIAKLVAGLPNLMLRAIASGAAAIIPISTYCMSHYELQGLDPYDWRSVLTYSPKLLLIACGLAYSAPTVQEWAFIWTGSNRKAWAFTVLLEGVQTMSHLPVLPLVCLGWLAGINLLVAANKTGKKKIKLSK